MTHIHDVIDTDIHYKIDSVTRVITNINEVKKTLVQYDHNSERLTFEIPRYIDSHDLTKCNCVEIHYINIESTGKEKYEDVYDVKDLGVKKDDEEIVIFTWLISKLSTQYAGTLNFIIRFSCVNEAGEIEYAWSTLIFKSIYISDGINNSQVVVENNSDILEQWRQRLFKQNEDGVTNITEAKSAALLEIDNVKDASKTEVDNAKTAAINEVAKKGRETLDSIPVDYNTLNEDVNKLKIVNAAKGSLISLPDSAEAPIPSMRIFGKSEQLTTTGKNLNPTSSIDTTISSMGALSFYDITPGTYTLSAMVTKFSDDGATNTRISVTVYYTDGTKTLVNGTMDTSALERDGVARLKSVSFTVDSEKTLNYITANALDYGSIGSGRNAKAENIQLEAGTVATPYEPFTVGMPSPNPNYPQEIKSVGDDGSVEQVVMGKNLLVYPYKDTTKTISGITFTDNGDGSVTANGTATGTVYFKLTDGMYLAKGIYILSGCPTGGSDSTYRIYGYVTTAYLADYGKGITLTVTEDVMTQAFYISIASGASVTNLTFKPMLRLASITDNTYEPYKSQSLTIPTPNGLPGVPVSSGGNYTDENGQQYVCDEIDEGRKVRVQRVGEYRNTGEAMGMASCVLSSDGKRIFWNTLISNACYTSPALCSHFRQSHYGVETQDYAVKFQYNNYLYFSIPIGATEYGTTYTTYREAVTAWLAKTFSEDNPLIVNYQLEEPIETPLTDEEIEAYKALHTNYPNTTIYNDDGAYTEVKYVADPKMYIDGKFAELQANILNATT